MSEKNKIAVAIAGCLISGLFSTQASAAGFALIENSASGMGNAYAGGAAIADDASTVWFNPAGMMRLSGSQIVVAGHIISPAADFTDNGSNTGDNAFNLSLNGDEDDGGVTAFVPNFYYVTELSENSRFGVGVTVPFGLSTDYDEEWVGRYHATKSEVQTININPSFAFKHNDKLSLGLGLSFQYIEATLKNRIDSTMTCAGIVAAVEAQTPGAGAAVDCSATTFPGDPSIDSKQALTGDDWNWGWNIGALYDIDAQSRIGVAYRSSIDANLSGDVNFTLDNSLQTALASFTNPPFAGTSAEALAGLFSDTGIDAGIELPAQISVSYYRDVTEDFAIMADITWTEWSNFNALVIEFDNLVQSTSIQPENWEDSYRFAVGGNYRLNEKMLLRMGVALDQTPIPSAEDRTARIPGDDRKWLSLGLSYTIDNNTSVDVGYSHLFVSDTGINNSVPNSGQILLGEYEADVDIFSVQASYKF